MTSKQSHRLSEDESLVYRSLLNGGWSHDLAFLVARGTITADKIAIGAIPSQMANDQPGAIMTTQQLNEWQARVVGTGYGAQTRAAKLLNTPLQTYRNWLYGRVEVPSPVERLAEYVERHGPLS